MSRSPSPLGWVALTALGMAMAWTFGHLTEVDPRRFTSPILQGTPGQRAWAIAWRVGAFALTWGTGLVVFARIFDEGVPWERDEHAIRTAGVAAAAALVREALEAHDAGASAAERALLARAVLRDPAILDELDDTGLLADPGATRRRLDHRT
ncbi:MAG: hypothetical protein H6732_11095 [Alphaproteobacteria bacterium]|nr:hypothetical protein [Alphaproteobacteria bacterium]